jgi:phospholipid/cholesterol/gamma-HCH transport system ATP-binding protein
MTSIAVTHDMSCAHIIADRIAVLDGGVICFDGTLDEMGNAKEDFVNQFNAVA